MDLFFAFVTWIACVYVFGKIQGDTFK